MRHFLESLFLHFFILMVIPLFNNILFRHKKTLHRKIIMTVVILSALFLTLIFPINLPNNVQFDMKFIPVFVAYFYLSPIAGFLSILEIIAFKAFTEPSQVFSYFINYIIMSLIFYSTNRFYKRFTMKQKISITLLIYLLIMSTRIIYFIKIGDSHFILHLLLSIVVSWLALASIIYIIEMNSIHVSMMEKLQNADKLNAISQLAASVAHEIRNPMTTIRGFLQLMKDERNLTLPQTSFVTISLSELDRTQNIINDFLSLAKPMTSEVGCIDVSKNLFDVIDFMIPFAVMSNVEITNQIDGSLHISGNQNEFKQLVINLIKNGIEAMPSGGKLTINASSIDNMVTITIKDKGIGMSKQQLNQLGQPYYSTKTKGTGLGLLISFDIIKRMNGKYEIQSEEQKGTCFTLKFYEVD
ncbi:HAMP domain-containing sensor histidine kinase [Bacillus sp. FJAT-49736]|uniref:sensor histidine kinase n=1 Tax=Bacillus sp. FJAT-49736 TaxID=2833582 RepID=UPI001BC9D1EF|nr:HAMP domain-containing sensor histidine kinase [Bacillus sp. FJAT-49736]MBS4175293.1 two-component sensor histidine kinase [Bacillus sp. FJAT-49736]